MRPVFTAEEMRGLDRRATGALGIPGARLMENAGRGAAEAILAALPRLGAPRRGARIVVVCGKGGNGGDGFVVARRLRGAGCRVRVLLSGPAAAIAGDAAATLRALRGAGLRPEVADAGVAGAALAAADLVVDALLGTGTRGAPTAAVAALIEAVNASGRPVVALDVPSGLDADGGPAPGPVVQAALTLTFAGLKRGLVMGPDVGRAGTVHVVPIGIPDAVVDEGVSVFLLEREDVARLFPRRPRDGHKGRYGHLLVVAGSLGKTGAAALAAAAAMRTGVGLVTVATPASQQPVVAGLVVEGMTAALPETPAATVALGAQPALEGLAAARDAVALGPGLGLEGETQALARALAATLPRPLVLDADALTAVAADPASLRGAPAARCLTPHPGEMARLLARPVAEVQRDRVATVREAAVAWNAHVALKGATTVVGDPEGRVYLNPTGNPGLASGGTGDVLTGMVGALLARGFEAGAALRAAVYLHGLAGDLAARRTGEEALIASDVVAALGEAFAALHAR